MSEELEKRLSFRESFEIKDWVVPGNLWFRDDKRLVELNDVYIIMNSFYQFAFIPFLGVKVFKETLKHYSKDQQYL